jgi:hypothetical protein
MGPSEDPSVVALVRRLRGVSFEWRENAPEGRSGRDLGVIAQEVEAVFPELVHTDEQGFKRVNYMGLIAPLIEAVKELDARLSRLEHILADHDDRS